MIKSFRCAATQAFYETGKSKKFSSIMKVATRKLAQLDAAATLEFLRSPPGNRLEALVDDRKGQHSIRINDQWRICFRWTDEGPEDVDIVDYHQTRWPAPRGSGAELEICPRTVCGRYILARF